MWTAWSEGQSLVRGRKETIVCWNYLEEGLQKDGSAGHTDPGWQGHRAGVNMECWVAAMTYSLLLWANPPRFPWKQVSPKHFIRGSLCGPCGGPAMCCGDHTECRAGPLCACHQIFRAEKMNAHFRNGSLSWFSGWKYSPNLTPQTNNYCLAWVLLVWLVYENTFCQQAAQ